MRSQQYTTSFSKSPSYLHSNFHYLGQYKIKGGKGYQQDGTPLGVESGPCKEKGCDGTIITLQMNVSRKGFTTSSEKVCNHCGKVYPLSFQLLGTTKNEESSPKKYGAWLDETPSQNPRMSKGQEAWKKDMQNSQSGPDIHEGEVPDIPEEKENEVISPFEDINKAIGTTTYWNYDSPRSKSESRLIKAIDRLDNTNTSKMTPMKQWRNNQYYELVKDHCTELGMNKIQISDSMEIIEKTPGILNISRYNSNDIVLCICMYVLSQSVSNSRMSVIKRQNPAWKLKLSPLYQTIKEKITNTC